MTDLESQYAEISNTQALNERRAQLQQALEKREEVRERQWKRYRRFMQEMEEWLRPISTALFYVFVADGPSRSIDHPALNGDAPMTVAYHDRDEAFQREVGRSLERKAELVRALRKTDRRIDSLRDHLEAVVGVRDRRLLSGEELSKGEVQGSTSSEPSQEESPIGGYYGPEYATNARDVLRRNPSINSFSRLKREMGESKVDTVKRNIGYDDLPAEEKSFSRFETLLIKKVKQLKEEG